MKEEKGLNISAKSFLSALLVIFILMIGTYLLTLIVPGGYIPFWKWALSPILVLGAEGNVSLIAIIIFLLIIGGIFNSLDKCGVMKYMLDAITHKFGKNKYQLLAMVTLFFMSMGAFIGSFEECVPLVPFVVALSFRLGWDAMVGLGMSLLAIGCGFASGVCNPFTVGVAQELAGLPMFSGMGFRFVCFVIIYCVLFVFLYMYAKKVENLVEMDALISDYEKNPSMDKGLIAFVTIMVLGILLVLSSVFITVIQDYTLIIVAFTFLLAGLSAILLSGGKDILGKTFVEGVVSVLPGVLMILMANSIKFTLVEGNILTTLLSLAIGMATSMPRWAVVLFIYFIVLFFNFFISSGSAKAFLLMPLIIPVAEAFGISSQLCIVAFAFGDGFSNILYPTNPVLLISLGLADVKYIDWFKWCGKFQLLNLLLTSLLLLIGLAIGY